MKKKRRLQRSDGCWLAAVIVLILLQFWWLPGDPGTPDDSYSSTIEGKLGVFQTLEQLSEAGLLPPVRRESRSLVPQEPCTLVLLSPDRYPDQNEQNALADFVIGGGTLVFAPNWGDPECTMQALSVRTSALNFSDEDTVVAGTTAPGSGTAPAAPLAAEADDDAASLLPADTAQDPSTPNSPAPSAESPGTAATPPVPADLGNHPRDVIDRTIRQNPGLQPGRDPTLADLGDGEARNIASDFQTGSQLVSGPVPWRTTAALDVSGLDAIVLVESTAGTPQAAAWHYGSGLVLVSASADVFSNRAMLDASQAELAVRLIEYAHAHGPVAADETPIVISEFLNASDSYRGTGVLMSPALRSGTLQLMTVALLAGWFGFHRFGPARRHDASQRRSLTESAAAVGNLHMRTNSGGEAVQGYLEYMKTQLQRMFGRAVHLGDTEMISARSGLDVGDVTSRLANATALAGKSFTTTSQAASAIRDLAEILYRLHGTSSGTKL